MVTLDKRDGARGKGEMRAGDEVLNELDKTTPVRATCSCQT